MNDYQARTFEQYEQGRMAKLVAMAAVVAGFARRRGEPRVPKRPAVKPAPLVKPQIVDSEGRAYPTRRAAASAWMVHENAICNAIRCGGTCRGLTFRVYNPKRDAGAALIQPGTVLATTKARRGNRYATEQERIEARRASRREWMRRYRQNADSDALQPRTDVSTPEPTPTPSEGEETPQRASKCERQAE